MSDRPPQDSQKRDQPYSGAQLPKQQSGQQAQPDASKPVSKPTSAQQSADQPAVGAAAASEPKQYVICPKCEHRNPSGTANCENCNTSLAGIEVGTKQFDKSERPPVTSDLSGKLPPSQPAQPSVTDTNEMLRAAVASAGSHIFSEDMVLRLEIEGAATPILLFPKKETVIGRRDPATGTMPDVDLTSYAGYRMGVSRRHAVIRLRNNEVEIFDLGSSNGTSVNGTKLQPHQPQPLRDGDEIALGKMNLRVLFQLRTRRRST